MLESLHIEQHQSGAVAESWFVFDLHEKTDKINMMN